MVGADYRMVYYGISVSTPRTIPMAKLHLPWQKVIAYYHKLSLSLITLRSTRIIYRAGNQVFFYKMNEHENFLIFVACSQWTEKPRCNTPARQKPESSKIKQNYCYPTNMYSVFMRWGEEGVGGLLFILSAVSCDPDI